MPTPGFPLEPTPEILTGAEAVETVMRWFKSTACTDADACRWLSAQARDGKLKLMWTDQNPDYLARLNLTGRSVAIFVSCFPAAQVTDEIDWRAGVVRRRITYPHIADRWGGRDPSTMTIDERLARDRELQSLYGEELSQRYDLESDEAGFERWIVEDLTYRFTVKRRLLNAILDRASMPLGATPVNLAEAAEIIASRFGVSNRMALHALIEAAATGRIEVYGKPAPKRLWQDDTISAWAWQQVARGEAVLSADATVLSTRGLMRGETFTWSDPHVFRADLERLVRELAGERCDGEAETGMTEPAAGTAEDRAELVDGTSGSGDAREPEAPDDAGAPRDTPQAWLARFVGDGKHRNRDSTLEAMRLAHPELGIRASLAAWAKFSEANPQLQLSRPGRKSKRKTNN